MEALLTAAAATAAAEPAAAQCQPTPPHAKSRHAHSIVATFPIIIHAQYACWWELLLFVRDKE